MKLGRPFILALPSLLLLAPGGAAADPLTAHDPVGIVGGTDVGVCGWPTTVSMDGGCTGTLVHPQAISTAQHCGMPNQVIFTDELGGPSQTRNVTQCVGTGSQDAQLCLLDEPVLELPVTPVLFGCELEKYLVVGQPVVIAGFGQTSYGMGGGEKLWADQTIAAVEPGRVIIGNAGDGKSPCPGDSGGPVFVQVADGSWRVFGTVLGGTTGTPCNSAADFQRIDPVVANFEAATGLDITPCFDGVTGDWDATEMCGEFFAGDHTGSGTWPDWCAGTPASGYSAECGEPFGPVDTGGTGGTGGSGGSTGGDATTSGTGGGSAGDTTGATGTGSTGYSTDGHETDSGTDGAGAGDADGGGCGCRGAVGAPPGWALLALLVPWRRRRFPVTRAAR